MGFLGILELIKMMKKIQVYLPKKYYKKIEKMIDQRYFGNESELVRDLVRRHLDEYIEDFKEEIGPAGVERR